jgi:intracellular sulfur oxidation DsrE/DsrF family protein
VEAKFLAPLAIAVTLSSVIACAMSYLKCFQAIVASTFVCGVLVQPALCQNRSSLSDMGRMVDIPGAHEMLDPAHDYKVIFSLVSVAQNVDDVNPGLKFIASFVNTFDYYKVPPSHRHFVAVFHGETVDLVVNDEAYKNRHNGHSNPNIKLMHELKMAGVQLVVCGQSALENNVDLKTIQSDVQLNLSATITYLNLESQGYIKIDK